MIEGFKTQGAHHADERPPHPGLAIRDACLEPLGLIVTAGAQALGVSRQALNSVVNGHAGISPEMAIRLAKAFGGDAAIWLGMQTAYDLAQARIHERQIQVKCYEPTGSQPAL